MNLLENLARNVDEWPECDFIVQDDSGICWPSMNGEATYSDGLWLSECLFDDFNLEKSEDNGTAKVTRDEWIAERQLIAMESISQLSQEQENAIEKQLRDESAKQYEQELWDKVAMSALQSMLMGNFEYTINNDKDRVAETDSDFAVCAFDYADAFMAERAKRMKGNQ